MSHTKWLVAKICASILLLAHGNNLVQFAIADPIKTSMLLAADEFDGRTPLILHPHAHRNHVYSLVLADADGGGATAQLVAIPLPDGKVKKLGRIAIKQRIGTIGVPFGIRSIVTATCLDRESYYAAIYGEGIVEFDLRNERTTTLVKSSALRDGSISSMLLVGDSLFVGTQGKLLRIRVMAKSAERVFDTANIDIASAKRKSIVISHQLHDAARSRLLFVVQARLDRRIEHGAHAQLWQYNLKTKKAQRLFRLGRLQSALTTDLDGDVLTLTDTWIARWNMANGKRSVVANYSLGDWQFTRKLWIPRMHHAVICQEAAWWVASADKLGTCAFPDGTPKEFDLGDFSFEVHGNTVGHNTLRIDDDHFLIYNAGRVLLATLSRGASESRD